MKKQSSSSQTFHYIQIERGDRRYYCREQSLGGLVLFLFSYKDLLCPIKREEVKDIGIAVIVRWLQRRLRWLIQNVKILKTFAKIKYNGKFNETAVSLPVFGQICIAVHRGFKVFDVTQMRVVKVFDSEVNLNERRNEIERLESVASLGIAPAIGRRSISEGWYEESLLRGTMDSSVKALDTKDVLHKFRKVIQCYLFRIIASQPAVRINGIEYCEELFENILGQMEERLYEYDVRMKAKALLNSLLNQTRIQSDHPIVLVFSHGDFCPANMLNTPIGLRIIDWEDSGYRSAFFDFFSYFFYRTVSRKIPVEVVISEINQLLPVYISEVLRKAHAQLLDNFKQSILLYRWVFYLEILARLLERERTDHRLNVKAYILRYLQVIEKLEGAAN